MIDNNGLVRSRRCTGTVDDPDMHKSDDRIIQADKRLDSRREAALRSNHRQ